MPTDDVAKVLCFAIVCATFLCLAWMGCGCPNPWFKEADNAD